jgi:hypothetical protein
MNYDKASFNNYSSVRFGNTFQLYTYQRKNKMRNETMKKEEEFSESSRSALFRGEDERRGLLTIFLLDGVRVGGALGGVDQLVGKTFGDGLDVTEGRFTNLDKRATGKSKKIKLHSSPKSGRGMWEAYTDGQEGDGLVDSS